MNQYCLESEPEAHHALRRIFEFAIPGKNTMQVVKIFPGYSIENLINDYSKNLQQSTV